MRPSYTDTMWRLEMIKQEREESELKERQCQLIDPSPYPTEGLRARERARLTLPIWQPLPEEKKKPRTRRKFSPSPMAAFVAVAFVSAVMVLAMWEAWGWEVSEPPTVLARLR